MPIRARGDGDFSRLSGELALTAYRLIQEALSNVVKHSAATVSLVRLAMSEDKEVLRIDVTDNGKGFDPHTTESGIGLIGMRERVHGAEGQAGDQYRRQGRYVDRHPIADRRGSA